MKAEPGKEFEDGFDVLMRRQGWHLTGSNPARKVIQWRSALATSSSADQTSFYGAFGEKRVRKLIRSMLSAPQGEQRSTQELAVICPNETRLNAILTYLQAGGIVTKKGARWSRGAHCHQADNIGQTLEWYVAEWFRSELKAPARYGVTVEEMANGADLDVVAFLGDTRVWVECKSSKPDDISAGDLKGFLQRAFDFRPEIAVLLIDTDCSVAKLAQDVRNLWNHLSALSLGKETPPVAQAEAEPVPGYSGIYWCARHVYVANVEHSVDRSLSNALRFHETYAKRQIFVPTVGVWDFVNGVVQPDSQGVQPNNEGPYAVEGMMWIQR